MPKNSKESPIKKASKTIKGSAQEFLGRRPHRSFRLTRRRDYKRSLQLPGYFAFTMQVNRTVWKYKKTMFGLAAVYAVLTFVLIGIGSQETYVTLTDTLRDTGLEIFEGNVGQIGQAIVLFGAIGVSGLNASPTEAQQAYMILVGLLVWLTTIWLLRNMLAGHKTKLRDGLYSAGSPIFATLLVTIVFALQLIPIGVAVVGYSGASAAGLLEGGVAAMLFWVSAALLTVISLYWIVSTFFALIIVTLPGTYPMRALRTAGDMVVGRRTRILFRILWMFGAVAVSSAIVLIPIILIVAGLTQVWPGVAGIPIVPFFLMLVSVCAFIWITSYVYLLYRKVVDDDAKPA